MAPYSAYIPGMITRVSAPDVSPATGSRHLTIRRTDGARMLMKF